MPTADTIQRSKQVRILVYGKFKMGKTEGAATFPRPNFISFDPGGCLTLTSPGFKERHPEVDLSQVQVQEFYERNVGRNGIVTAHNAFDDATEYFEAWMKPGGGKWKSPYDGQTYDCHPDKFDTWVIDSATTLYQAAQNKAIMLMGNPQFAGKVLSTTYDKAKQFGMIAPKIQDFGAERSLAEQFIRMVYDSGKHVILLCHEKEEYEGQGDNARIVGIVPLLTGQSVERVGLLFSDVLRLIGHPEGKGYKRYLMTVPSGVAKAGSRLEIPDGTPWNWTAISAAINGTPTTQANS
jgi:hypothetical protein